jgi:hypothetical protein
MTKNAGEARQFSIGAWGSPYAWHTIQECTINSGQKSGSHLQANLPTCFYKYRMRPLFHVLSWLSLFVE